MFLMNLNITNSSWEKQNPFFWGGGRVPLIRKNQNSGYVGICCFNFDHSFFFKVFISLSLSRASRQLYGSGILNHRHASFSLASPCLKVPWLFRKTFFFFKGKPPANNSGRLSKVRLFHKLSIKGRHVTEAESIADFCSQSVPDINHRLKQSQQL